MHRASLRKKRGLTCSSPISKGKTETLMPVSSLERDAKQTSRHNRRDLLTFGNRKGEQLCESSQSNVSLAHWLQNGGKPHQRSVLPSLLSKDYFASLEVDR